MDLLNKFVIRIEQKSEGDAQINLDLINKLTELVGTLEVNPNNINKLLEDLAIKISEQQQQNLGERGKFVEKVEQMLKTGFTVGQGGGKKQKKSRSGGSGSKGRKQNGGFIRDRSHADS
jgi:hypothetical protein